MAMRTTILSLLALGAVWSGPATTQTRELGSAGTLIEGIAAVVDEGVVLRSELDMRLNVFLSSYELQQSQLPIEQRQPLPPRAILEEQVLDQLVLKEIQMQRAERIGIVVGDDILNAALGEMAGNLGISLEDLPRALEAEGVDYEMYREDSRDDIALAQLEQRDVISRIRISPRELDQCLARLEETQSDEFDFNVSHILIALPRGATQDQIESVRARAERLHQELEDGANFAQLAIANSDTATALEGGSLGWRKGAELPTFIAEIVPEMEAGDISEIVQTGGGFNIIRLNDVRGVERIMVDQVRARHILIAPNELLDDQATEQKMLGLREQLLAGEDFATIAVANSEDTVSAADGGDLGWNEPDAFVPEFSERMTSQEIGFISEPFRTRFGWHIMEVTDRRSYDTTDDLKQDRCARQIRDSKVEEERQLWLQQLRDNAFVDIRI
jgi:peptidyl-prolyl cis-trans isomerase SurA